ncbi:MAG: hypothetical protein JSR96_08230 [Proteobacteria bacterium]|nr:hypothetical protein [Pseudomonadota bacterium]
MMHKIYLAAFSAVSLAFAPAALARTAENDAQAFLDYLTTMPIPSSPADGSSAYLPSGPFSTWTPAQQKEVPERIGNTCMVMWTMAHDAPQTRFLPKGLDEDEGSIGFNLCLAGHMPADWPQHDALVDQIKASFARAQAAGSTLKMPAAIAGPAHTWELYQNPRFGTQAEFPADLFGTAIKSENGDGARWTASGGASLRIFGFWNTLKQRPAAYEAFLHEAAPQRYAGVTFRTVRQNLMILSGTDHGTVFYERYAFGDSSGAVHALVLEYPATARMTFDPLVTRISSSLRWTGSPKK